MKLTVTAVALALAFGAFAVRQEWEQCGGIGWTGETVCAQDLSCVYQSDWYSQCLKTGTTPAPTTIATTSTSVPSSTTTPVTGFVKVSGQKFTLNGKTFNVVGTNSYWVGLNGLKDNEMDEAFRDMANLGATAVRTWGFNDVTSPNGIYYQSWSGSTATVNTGSNGLAQFDKVIQMAKAYGLRLIVPLTNNWADYGGMDVYVNQILGSGKGHDLFYTDSRVIAAFKNYINTFVTRYKNEPGILAWELANEPRCRGSTGATTGTCTTATITKWARDISAYIKSIDSNHLVALGDEGFFNQPNGPNYPYQGGEGIDFVANLQIPTLDFATFHAYPDTWGQSANAQAWGVQWIKDHAAEQVKANKPAILEEFGFPGSSRTNMYSSWYSTIESVGLSGDMIWQAGTRFSTGWSSHDDTFTIYPSDPVYALQQSHNAKMKART